MEDEETEKITLHCHVLCRVLLGHGSGVPARQRSYCDFRGIIWGVRQLHPTYEEVSTGKTGHSEVVMIAYDPGRISYRELLDIFFKSHDPCKRAAGALHGNTV